MKATKIIVPDVTTCQKCKRFWIVSQKTCPACPGTKLNETHSSNDVRAWVDMKKHRPPFWSTSDLILQGGFGKNKFQRIGKDENPRFESIDGEIIQEYEVFFWRKSKLK